jgi:hypothetical protein
MNGNRMRLLAILTLLVVFVAGGLVGAALEHGRHDSRRDRLPRVERRGGPPPLFAEGSPVAERLNLTEAQRDSIEKITTRDRVRADSVFRETRRRMRSRFDSTMMAVDSVLTPQQRAEWQKIRQEIMERERREGRGRRGPGGRGGPNDLGAPGGPGGPGMPPPAAPPRGETGGTAPSE